MNKMQRIFCAVLTVWAGYLTYANVQLDRRVGMYQSIFEDQYRQMNTNSLILDNLMSQIPPEVERISRRVAKEEGIKLFKEFGENFKKLSQEGQ